MPLQTLQSPTPRSLGLQTPSPKPPIPAEPHTQKPWSPNPRPPNPNTLIT